MDDLRQVWQSQEVEEMKFSVEELRAKAAKFQRRVKNRNLRELLAAAIVVVWCGVGFWKTDQAAQRVISALLITGAAYVMWYIWTKAGAKSVPEDIGRAGCASFYRAELVRQRDLAGSVWKWYIGPIVPGIALAMIYGIVTAAPARRWVEIAWTVAVAALFWGVGWLNQRGARRLDRRIAELDRELGSAPAS